METPPRRESCSGARRKLRGYRQLPWASVHKGEEQEERGKAERAEGVSSKGVLRGNVTLPDGGRFGPEKRQRGQGEGGVPSRSRASINIIFRHVVQVKGAGTRKGT